MYVLYVFVCQENSWVVAVFAGPMTIARVCTFVLCVCVCVQCSMIEFVHEFVHVFTNRTYSVQLLKSYPANSYSMLESHVGALSWF